MGDPNEVRPPCTCTKPEAHADHGLGEDHELANVCLGCGGIVAPIDRLLHRAWQARFGWQHSMWHATLPTCWMLSRPLYELLLVEGKPPAVQHGVGLGLSYDVLLFDIPVSVSDTYPDNRMTLGFWEEA